MTLAKPTSTDTASLNIAMADAEHSIDLGNKLALEDKLSGLATQATHGALDLWAEYQPVTADKTQAVWQLLRTTQPVQLLLAAAIAVLAIALVALVSAFGGLIILCLKLAALVLAAVAVWQWVSRGVSWADDKLPTVGEGQE